MPKEKIKIGKSYYTRDQLSLCRNGADLYDIGKTARYLLPIIEAYEAQGYTVEFRMPPLAKVLGYEEYSVIAIK